MRRAPLISLLLMLHGCMSQPRALPLIGAPSPGAGHRLVVELTLPRQVQATVSRNLVAMIDHYTATLLMWDGSSFIPLAAPLSGSTTELSQPKFAFDHLGPGRYHVRAIAYDTTNTPLTSEGTAEIDLTGNDVDTAPQVTVPLSMLPVAFSATLPLPSNATTPGSVPVWVTGLEAVVSVGGTEIARHSYAPNQAPKLKRLATGITYDVTVTATNGSGHTDNDSYAYFADPTAASLDDAPTHAFSLAPFLSTYTAGNGPVGVVMDAAGNAWVANQNTSNVTRISATGSLSTYAVGSFPSMLAIDGSGTVWVPSQSSTTVTRISATGSLSTFTAGTNPIDVAIDSGGNVWVANIGSNNVTRISTTGSKTTFTVGTTPQALAVDGSDNIWVANYNSNNVTRISSTGSKSTFTVGTGPASLAVDGAGNAWFANYGSANVTRVSSTGSLSTFTAGTNPNDIAVDGAGNAWVVNKNSANVTRISSTGSLSTFAVGSSPDAVAVDALDNVWVANSGSTTVSRISATGGRSTFTVGTAPCNLIVSADGSVWVPNFNSANVTRIQP